MWVVLDTLLKNSDISLLDGDVWYLTVTNQFGMLRAYCADNTTRGEQLIRALRLVEVMVGMRPLAVDETAKAQPLLQRLDVIRNININNLNNNNNNNAASNDGDATSQSQRQRGAAVVGAVRKETTPTTTGAAIDAAVSVGAATVAVCPATASSEPFYLYPVPAAVPERDRWRYKSNDIFWTQHDSVYWNFHVVLNEMRARHGAGRVVPPEIDDETRRVVDQLNGVGLGELARIFQKAYPYTLQHTTFPLFDGTTYVITGDIPLMWQRDSSAQVNHYIPLLKKSAALTALVEGLIRRQMLFVLADPYGTSFRLYLDFDHVGKQMLTDWDFQSGRTIHIAMHNWELDNLAYVLRLAWRFWKATNRVAVFDATWLRALDLILDTLECEQKHNEVSTGVCYGAILLANADTSVQQ